MSDSLPDDNLIATLERSLRQTRKAQKRLLVRLREAEDEVERLRQDYEAYENSAEQTQAAIYSLLDTMRSGSNPRHPLKNLRLDDDGESPQDIRRLQPPGRGDSAGSPLREEYGKPSSRYQENDGYTGGGRDIPSISRYREPISTRFADRTITQACTLLLRESGEPMHVNELYNFLVSGSFPFKGNNPTISIAVSLNRNKRFRKVAPGTFDLVMRDVPKAS